MKENLAFVFQYANSLKNYEWPMENWRCWRQILNEENLESVSVSRKMCTCDEL